MRIDAQPAVSIVVPVFNGASFVADAIESVLAQTLPDFELIVVDDGSTDGTDRIVGEQARRDPRVSVLRQANMGLSAARNAGLDVARGELVAFLDSDDVWLPRKLEFQVAHLAARPDCEACFTHIEEVDNTLRVVRRWGADLEREYRYAWVNAALLVECGNVVAGSGSGVVARAEAVRQAGGFDERLRACEDLDLWYRLALRAPLEAVPTVLVRIRRTPGQMQSDFGRVLDGRIEFLENVQRYGDRRHGDAAAGLQRHLRRQLFRRSLRQGELWRSGAQVFALLAPGRGS